VNDHDWAVVIGIGQYADAQTQPPWITNLNGPANDAAAVAEWLKSRDGGALCDDHVCLICSAVTPGGGGDAGPDQTTVAEAFDALTELPTNAYEGQYAGRRIYVYVSGHGMAAQRTDAAVITAEATRDNALNVLVTSWLDWLWYAARFKEYVLWVDTCATRPSPPITLYACDRPRRERSDAARGKRFEAFAAGYNYTAVEAELEGNWHGVFTHALLKGLRGATGTPVTTENLRKYLFNSMKSFMTPEQLKNPAVGHEPAFLTTDELVFAAPAEQSTFATTLQFPQTCVGKRATIIVNQASPSVATTILQEAEWTLQLPVGVYVAFVPELSFVLPFQVTGGG
jgi:uncharacterized caspase-like protein